MAAEFKQSDIFTHIIKTLNLTSAGIKKRKAFHELSDADFTLLQELAIPMGQIQEHIMKAFYGHLDKFPETSSKLNEEKIREHLLQKQKNYLDELFSGNYDQQYFNNRLHVGIAHQKIGLDPKWYIGAYSKYLCSLIPELISNYENDITKAIASIQSLLKIVLLDIGLVLEAYFQADRQAIEALKDYAENIVCSVPAGLIVLDSELKILSANRHLDDLSGLNHSKLRGMHLNAVLPELGIAERIKDVIFKGVPQTGIYVNQIGSNQNKSGDYEISIIPVHLSPSVDELTQAAQVLVIMQDITLQNKLRQKTAETDSNIHAIMEHVPDGIITINSQGIIETFNSAACKLFGYELEDVIGKNIKILMPEQFSFLHDGYISNYLEFGNKNCLGVGFRELEGKHKNGTTFPIDLSINEMAIGDKKKFIGIVRDISEKHKAEARMKVLSTALEQTADAIMITDNRGNIEYVNTGFVKTTGFKRPDIKNKTPNILNSGKQTRAFYQNMWNTINSGNVFRDVVINKKKDGTLYYEEKTITPLLDDDDNITHFISSGKDITERMMTQERLHYLAHHDILTDLPNRLLFMERLTHALSRGQWGNRYVALLFLDLDRFKNINDTLGHYVGDELLQLTAKRLSGCVREGDLVSRVSGDEFAILLEDIANLRDIPKLVNNVLNALANPFVIQNRELHVTTSIGVAVYPKDTLDPHELLQFADVAMYRAKAKGRNNFHLYTADLNSMTEETLLLENQLRKALDREEFELHYQPQVNLKNNCIAGMEALLRWNNPIRGKLLPDQFIYMLEETGLIIPVGNWVISAACKQLHQWREQGLSDISISINVAPRQLSNPGFFTLIRDNLEKYQLSPKLLNIEITESTLMENEESTTQTIVDICNHGISLVMDDFGTGYSSLSYLRRFPITTVKIDKSFIADVPKDEEDCALTRATISLCEIMNQKVVAEGVENQEQLNFLSKYGCHIVQGFYISEPLPETEALQFCLDYVTH